MRPDAQRCGPAPHGDASADAIVVGGGPAGSVTALLLARAGRRVVMVERRSFPRAKPCGDCLSAAATGLLARLGLLGRVLAAEPARLAGWTIVAPAGHACHGELDGMPALALERRILDQLLLSAARDAGVRVVHGRATGLLRGDGTPASRRESADGARVRGVRVITPPGELRLRAPVVVGADGLRSVVARQLGAIRRRPRLRKVSLTTHGSGGDATGRGEMHVLDGGCIGFAPAGERFNLTLVVDATHAGRLRDLGPEAFLADWLQRAPRLRGRVDLGGLERPFLASGPFDWPTRSPVAPGAALVGDAAGYFDPFTGQGVYQAMEGGRLLAEALADRDLRDTGAVDAALRGYARRLRRLKRSARRVQWLIEVALARPARANRVLRRLGRAPTAMNRLLEVTGDLRPAADLLSAQVLSSLVFPPGPEVR